MTATNILFEVGLEEIPARFLDEAKHQLEVKTKAWLEDLRVPYEDISVFVTPRRLAVIIKNAAEKQPDIEEEAKGPAKKIALDDKGEWTKAAVGFTAGQGKSVEDIYTKEVKGTEYIFVNKFVEGQHTFDLLSNFAEVILHLNFPKSMRWGDLNLRYVRPIRWIAALYGDKVIPLEIAGTASSNITYGHRFLGESVELRSAEDYQAVLREQYVIVEPMEREKMIRDGIDQLQAKNEWQVAVDQDLLNEVKHLVEYPTVFSGAFDEEFLVIPEEALITSMKEHQRYFPVRSRAGKLLPNFIGVRNGDNRYLDTVARGNEKVLKARLSDARFFYEEDKKQTIENNLKKLERMVFQEKLGTIAEKTNRVTRLTESIADLLALEANTRQRAIRAAEISKFDLVTNMVNEFTELQGVMGERYASLFGEDERTAAAINEHYMPRHAGDNLPKTVEGALVSVADKLDTIIGCISVGIIPSGSQDPYALRRQAMGVLQIIKVREWPIRLEQLIEATYQQFAAIGIPTREKREIIKDVEEFFKHRASFIMKDANIEQDVIEATLDAGIGYFDFTFEKASLLKDKRQDENFKTIQEALVRAINLADKATTDRIKTELFENESERLLYEAYQRVTHQYQNAIAARQAEKALDFLEELAQPIHGFFDHTMVMTKDEALKNNRLALLNSIAIMIQTYADLTKVQWKQQY
ncbi:glycine--tRNA ligase subunit beta [Sediminibacillus albus]|uniref:Glycine--tRNA ligase beta subunit n=1 Tax=Sediminibacillus albus TaxID=407036 RepID=A0A1G9CQF5_9BACI|nr:glycine--tRNA ligase subunit beta [Sediminibacillus albus]SDK53857.1 glycyl-tRNA synthetase beta chain [Sediminibacillus albus]